MRGNGRGQENASIRFSRRNTTCARIFSDTRKLPAAPFSAEKYRVCHCARNRLAALRRIYPLGSEQQRFVRNVRRGDLNPARRHGVIQNTGQGPHLFSRRTGGAPYIDPVAVRKLRDNIPAEKLEMTRLAKKCRMVRGQGIDHRSQRPACRVPEDMTVVIVIGPETAPGYEPAKPRRNEFLFPGFEIQAEGAIRQLTDLLELLRCEGLHRIEIRRGGSRGINGSLQASLP